MRIVIDTNVLVEGLSRKGPCGHIVDLWVARKIVPCVSTALALQYEDVLTRRKSAARQNEARLALQALLQRAEFVPIAYTFRPQSPDPGDDLVIDCAMNAGTGIVTSNIRHFQLASKRLEFKLMTPDAFLTEFKEG